MFPSSGFIFQILATETSASVVSINHISCGEHQTLDIYPFYAFLACLFKRQVISIAAATSLSPSHEATTGCHIESQKTYKITF